VTEVAVDAPELLLLGGDEDEETGIPRYNPGDTLPGIVRLLPRRELRCRGVYVVARWRSVGLETVDRGVGPERSIHRGDLDPAQSVELQFQYVLPWEPWSYAGRLVRVEWELEVRLDVPWGRDRVAVAPFILAPPPPFESQRRAGPATRRTEG
jgi:hypothetical protein